MTQLKTLLLCNNSIALPLLQQLAFNQLLVAVAIPVRNKILLQDVKMILQQTNIAVVEVKKETNEQQLLQLIQQKDINLGLMFTYSYKLTEKVFSLPQLGFYNIHPGHLPQYRGSEPIFWQIKNKEQNAGICIHKVDKNYDSGPVVLSNTIAINNNDTYGLLCNKISMAVLPLAANLIQMLAVTQTTPSINQDESKAVYYKKPIVTDIFINWAKMNAAQIIALVNACNPWNKGAYTKINGKIIRLLAAEPANITESKQPGTIIAINKTSVIVAAADNSAVTIFVIYLEEGFFSAEKLAQFGVAAGHLFQ
jgi:methionyl-tRNA formyltransferase